MRPALLFCLMIAVALVSAPLTVKAEGTDAVSEDRVALERDARAAVARRNAAVNANDIDAFLGAYHPDFKIYEYPDKFLGTGTDRMRDIFGPIFAAGGAAVTVGDQMTLEHTVVSFETLSLNGVAEDLISIYTVENGQITQVRLIELED